MDINQRSPGSMLSELEITQLILDLLFKVLPNPIEGKYLLTQLEVGQIALQAFRKGTATADKSS